MMLKKEKENLDLPWSVLKCELGCKPLKTRSERAAKAASNNPHFIATHVNPSTCPYTYVKIDGNFYKRLTHGDEQEFRGLEESFVEELKDERPTCHDCSVPYGNTHHVGCDAERCPVCQEQFIFCGHNFKTRYFRGLADNKGTSHQGRIITYPFLFFFSERDHIMNATAGSNTT
jgi:hypothetical protein